MSNSYNHGLNHLKCEKGIMNNITLLPAEIHISHYQSNKRYLPKRNHKLHKEVSFFAKYIVFTDTC